MRKRPDEHSAETAAAYVEALFREHRGPLHRYLTGLLYNAEDAAELLQETYLRLLRQEGLEHIEANARAYIFQIATNLARDYFRQRTAHSAERHTAVETHLADEELLVPEASVQWDDTLARFKAALMKLDPRVRDVFLLHRFRDMTYPDIARELNIGLRSVERYMSEAMTELKQTLDWDI